MTDHPSLPSPAALRAQLDALRAERGYLLPHHGPLLAAAPDLHAAYRQMYAALTLTQRHLDPFEKEFVWLVLLVALREEIGTHHLDLFRRAGGTAAQAQLACQLAGYAAAAEGFAFAAQHWRDWFPALDPADGYLDGARRLIGAIVPEATATLALLTAQAAAGRDWGVAAHLRAACRAGIAEEKLVEALALLIWPAGVNRFVAACTVWRALILAGDLAPSPRFRAWAEMDGQGAFALPPG